MGLPRDNRDIPLMFTDRAFRADGSNRLGSETTAEVMRFDITGAERSDDSAVPDRVSNSKALEPRQAVATRTFLFRQGTSGMWTINDLTYQPGRTLTTPRLGTVEISATS